MPKFHFRLSTVLGLRQSARDECRLRLAESGRAEAEIERQVVELQGQQARAEAQQRRAAGPGNVRLDAVAQSDRYAAALRAQEADLCRRRETLAAEIERRRQTLAEADREVKTLEKLRERALARHQLETARQERRCLDENDRATLPHIAN